MAIMTYLVSQFHRPRGSMGALAGRLMATRRSNVDRNLWLVDLLQIEPDHRVLELGPGPGVALAAAARVVTDGQLVAVDHSTTMLRQASRRNTTAVAERRLRLVEASAEALPADLGRFDRIYCMNVWQFWDEQERVIDTLVDHLDAGGMLAVGFQPRNRGATAADADAAGRCLEDQFAEAGLVETASHQLDLDPVPAVAVLGLKPGISD